MTRGLGGSLLPYRVRDFHSLFLASFPGAQPDPVLATRLLNVGWKYYFNPNATILLEGFEQPHQFKFARMDLADGFVFLLPFCLASHVLIRVAGSS